MTKKLFIKGLNFRIAMLKVTMKVATKKNLNLLYHDHYARLDELQTLKAWYLNDKKPKYKKK